MIDLLTIAFRDELAILKVQAESVELYCEEFKRYNNLRTIYVIVNDEDSVVDLIDPNWWGALSSHVKIIPRSIFSIGYLHPNGWVTQQIFKMLGASLSFSDWTLVLDAKTIFIEPLVYQNLITSKTISKQTTYPILPAWQDSAFHKEINSLFDISLDCSIAPNGVPFLFHNNTIRGMIHDITKKTNEVFSDWFQRQYSPSEFLLYAGYLKYLHGSVDAMFSDSRNYKVNNICHSDPRDYETSINDLVNGKELITVSIHRNVWKELSVDHKKSYINFLLTKNITSARELV